MSKIAWALIAVVYVCPLSHADTPKERYVEFDYQVKLDHLPPGTAQLKIWLPIMPENDYQRIEDIEITPGYNSRLTFDETYGNKILYYAFQPPQAPLSIQISYKVRRREYSNKPAENRKVQTSPGEDPEALERFLKPDRLVTISPRARELASGITEGKMTTVAKARAIYDYVFTHVAYDKTIPGWGRGDTERVCLIRAGNCTDFHSLFISLARAGGIPAKFVMGVPLSEKDFAEIPGYHCWAEFYDEGQGWIPVDVSEAWKNKTRYEYFFGTLNQNRLEFTQGRDIILEPSQKGEPLNYFIYPYIEADGKEFKDYSVKFQFRNGVQRISKAQ
ncbi:MAG: hypothetical protein A2705_01365 [Omnitrophica WOR_2 bacterium RIFCSPHIGHO2_01_FULL_52_10]|nr:MAG: hypothetical protein A2705_01365 [Omnitrophica WOR_2 bacterium RIFCSPHIGHO2_01_FULL_52_10]